MRLAAPSTGLNPEETKKAGMEWLMRPVRLADYCCQGGDRVFDQDRFTTTDLIISTEGKRELFFSPLGNTPRAPKLALVGITPGGQSKKFSELLEINSVELAAKKAAFAGAQKAIKALLNAHEFLKALNIDCSGDLNDSDDIFTTSLVKCCLKVDGSYKYAAPEIAASRAASYCVQNRFIGDIERLSTLTHVVIFGEPGWQAINLLRKEDQSIKRHLESRGLVILNLPHFAQNYQQRAIYQLDPTGDESYLRAKPSHRAYAAKATEMRRRMLGEVRRLGGLQGSATGRLIP
jgi:hypothetical protein